MRPLVQIAKNEFDTNKQVYDQRVAEFDAANQAELDKLGTAQAEKNLILEDQLMRGLKTEREVAQERFEMQEEFAQMEYRQLTQKAELLGRIPLSEDPETRAQQLNELNQLQQQAANKKLEIQRMLIDEEKRLQEEAREDLEREIANSIATVEEAEAAKAVELERLVQARVLSEEEAQAQMSQFTIDRIKEELAGEAQRLALMRQERPRTAEEERLLQERIQQSRIRSSQLSLQLLQAEKAAQQAAIEAVRAAIDKEMEKKRNDATEQQQLLELQSMAYDAITKMVENVIAIEKQRLSLVESTSNYMRSQYDIAIGLADSEEEAQKLKEESLKAQLDIQKVEHELQKQALEYDILRNKILREREKIQNSIAQVQSQADLAQAKADLAKVQANPKASAQEIRAAELQVEAAQMQASSTVMERYLIDQQITSEAEAADIQRQQLSQQQSTENLSLRSELATIQEDEVAQRQIQNEALSNARNTATNSNGPRLRAQVEQVMQNFYSMPSQPIQVFEDRQITPMSRGLEPVLIAPNFSVSLPKLSSKEEVLERLVTAIESQVEKLSQPRLLEASPTLNNYFQGNVDKKAVDDSQQQFLQNFDQLLRQAGQVT